MPRRHCSDEQLLQYLDGELPIVPRWRVPWHLRRCWRCRTRLAGIEAQVHTLVRRLDDHPFPQELLETARMRFLHAATAVDANVAGQALSTAQPAARPNRLPAPRILIGVAVSLSAFAWWHFAPLRPAKPAAVPAAASAIRAKIPPADVSTASIAKPLPLPVAPLIIPQEKLRPIPDLDDLEVHALHALHQARACLGGEIHLVRSDAPQLEITGIVESAAMRDQITNAIWSLDHRDSVKLNLHTIAELPIADLPPVALAEPGSQSEPLQSRMPLESALIQSYASLYPSDSGEAIEKRVLALSNQVLRRSTAALDDAWAIRNLATRYPASRFDRLPPTLAGFIREMVKDHVANLASTCSDLATQFTPLSSLASPDSLSADNPSSGSWQTSAAELLREVQRVSEDAHQLFSVTGKPIDDPISRARHLHAALLNLPKLAGATVP